MECGPFALINLISTVYEFWQTINLLGADRGPRNLIIGVLCWAACRRTLVACIANCSSVQWKELGGWFSGTQTLEREMISKDGKMLPVYPAL